MTQKFGKQDRAIAQSTNMASNEISSQDGGNEMTIGQALNTDNLNID
jgi:hypothetical protein